MDIAKLSPSPKGFALFDPFCPNLSPVSDLEKAASGASGACGHFVGNHGILRTF